MNTYTDILKSDARRAIRTPHYGIRPSTWAVVDLLHTPEWPLWIESDTAALSSGIIRARSALPSFFNVEARHVSAVRALVDRYQRFCHYMTEQRHNWTEIRQDGFADNSIESVQVSALTGEQRRRLTVCPHGDVCF